MSNHTHIRGELHPQAVKDFYPKKAFKPSSLYTKDSYDGLSDSSPYSHYAWAFLRRNRFYQSSVDQYDANKRQGKYLGYPGTDQWAFPVTDEYFSIGLINATKDGVLRKRKPYWENYEEGTAVEWEGIHSFCNEHFYGVVQDRVPKRPVTHDYDPSHVWVCFDLKPFFGEGTTSLAHQIELAKQMLQLRAAKEALKYEWRQGPHKDVLRRLLYVADLLSPQVIEDSDIESESTAEKTGATDGNQDSSLILDFDPTGIQAQEVARKLPASDFQRNSAYGNRRTQTYAFISEAYQHIYEWKLLALLPHDNWQVKEVEVERDGKKMKEPQISIVFEKNKKKTPKK